MSIVQASLSVRSRAGRSCTCDRRSARSTVHSSVSVHSVSRLQHVAGHRRMLAVPGRRAAGSVVQSLLSSQGFGPARLALALEAGVVDRACVAVARRARCCSRSRRGPSADCRCRRCRPSLSLQSTCVPGWQQLSRARVVLRAGIAVVARFRVVRVTCSPISGSHDLGRAGVHVGAAERRRAADAGSPPAQASPFVQALPSLQGAPLFVWLHTPSSGRTPSSVQTLLSLQLTAVPGTQAPRHADVVRSCRALPSLQGALFGDERAARRSRCTRRRCRRRCRCS